MNEDIDPADWNDPDFRESYRQYHGHGRGKGYKKLKFTCPDCGEPNAISQWHKEHGYHCDACTRRTESGI